MVLISRWPEYDLTRLVFFASFTLYNYMIWHRGLRNIAGKHRS